MLIKNSFGDFHFVTNFLNSIFLLFASYKKEHNLWRDAIPLHFHKPKVNSPFIQIDMADQKIFICNAAIDKFNTLANKIFDAIEQQEAILIKDIKQKVINYKKIKICNVPFF